MRVLGCFVFCCCCIWLSIGFGGFKVLAHRFFWLVLYVYLWVVLCVSCFLFWLCGLLRGVFAVFVFCLWLLIMLCGFILGVAFWWGFVPVCLFFGFWLVGFVLFLFVFGWVCFVGRGRDISVCFVWFFGFGVCCMLGGVCGCFIYFTSFIFLG